MAFPPETAQDADKFTDRLNRLASNVGTHAWSQLTVATKAMIELVEPVSAKPPKLVRKYSLTVPANAAAAIPRTQTDNKFEAGTLVENITVAN